MLAGMRSSAPCRALCPRGKRPATPGQWQLRDQFHKVLLWRCDRVVVAGAYGTLQFCYIITNTLASPSLCIPTSHILQRLAPPRSPWFHRKIWLAINLGEPLSKPGFHLLPRYIVSRPSWSCCRRRWRPLLLFCMEGRHRS
eukprot:SAG31_NODE_4747_length_2984_cov_3.461698_2_plen_141_part_00